MRRKRRRHNKPKVAPGMTDFLEKEATRKEIRRGKFTRVTRLSYDETD